MIRSVSFVSQLVACGMSPSAGQAIVSITEPGLGPALLKPGWSDILRLEFHDVDAEVEGYSLFTDAQADAVMDWLDAVEERVDAVVVHCVAGISRSAAVAKFIAGRCEVAGFDHDYLRYNRLVYRVLMRRWTDRRRPERL
jgi:predicted protein tyrosine phosphatase